MVSWLRGKGGRPVYPFNAIVGQETAKTVLILNAIDPSIGGALISGPKGSGKSLLASSFSWVLPSIETVAGCIYNCNPRDPTNMCPGCRERRVRGERLPVEGRPMRLVKVPLSVTEEMMVGSIDLDRAVTEGIRALQPGLLAKANQNILYIDEVNLLPDHITDSILDAAASGWNTVEREGISIQHPSQFVLVGTMNPEEGELRPQILDRFGLYAETDSLQDPERRGRLLERNQSFRKNPYMFIDDYREGLDDLRGRIEEAREMLSEVEIPGELYSLVAETCSRLEVDGFRPDIVAVKAARALAAFKGKTAVEREDILASLELSLGHRTRSSGLSPPPEKREIHRALDKAERGREISIHLGMPELRQLLVSPKSLFKQLFRKAVKNLILRVLTTILMVASLAYLLDKFRSSVTGFKPSAITLIIEGASAIILTYILTRLLRRGQQREEVALGILDQSNMSIETSGRLRQPQAEKTGTGGGGLQAKVRYTGEDTASPRFGPKILNSLESLQRRAEPARHEAGERPRKRKGGGYTSGRRTKVVSSSSRGRYAWYRTPRGKEKPGDIALTPTIKTAALKQREREGEGEREREREGVRTIIKPEDIRIKVREYSAPYSIILLVDMSLSMTESVDNIVETIYSLHREVYRRRDRVGLIVFKGSKAYTLQHPTRNLDLVVKKLRNVGASDFTPMAAGLYKAWKLLRQEKLRNRDALLHLYIISDGITNVPLETPLSPLTRRRYTSEAQADAIDAARLLAKEEIDIHVFNTDHKEEEAETPSMNGDRRTRLTPTQFLIQLAHISGGRYKGTKLQKTSHKLDKKHSI